MRLHAKFYADRSNVCGDMADFRFFNMAAVRYLGFVLRVGDHPRRAFVGLCHFAKSGFKSGAVVLIICQF